MRRLVVACALFLDPKVAGQDLPAVGIADSASRNAVNTPSFGFLSFNLSDPLSGKGIATADFNGDGQLDIAHGASAGVAVMLADRLGSFARPVISRRPLPTARTGGLVGGDFNRDGKADLLTYDIPTSPGQTGPGQTTITVWLGSGDGTLRPQTPVAFAALAEAFGAVALIGADCDGDGATDLIAAQAGNPVILVLRNRGDGTFEPPVSYPLLGTGDINNGVSAAVAAGDMNGDGKLDLVALTSGAWSQATDNLISVLPGRGDGSFGPARTSQREGISAQDPLGVISLGDVNGDGLLDVVVANNSRAGESCSISVFLGLGDGTVRLAGRYPCALVGVAGQGVPLAITVADLTNDGKPDVAALFLTDDLQVFPGNGDGTFQAAAAYQSGIMWGDALVAGDFDRNGRMDLLASSFGQGVRLLSGRNAPFLRVATSLSGPSRARQPVQLSIVVSNSAAAFPAEDPVAVSVTVYSSGGARSIGGTGWTCSRNTGCTSQGPLANGSSYPPITVELVGEQFGDNVLQVRTTVTGGGSAATGAVNRVRVLPGTSAPLIRSVRPAGGFDTSPIAPNGWIEILGDNLVPATAPPDGVVWSNAPEFAAGRMPADLNGVRVSVNGKPGYVYFYCSAATNPGCIFDQINVLTPPDTIGPGEIIVRNGSVSSAPFPFRFSPVAPTFLSFTDGWVAASHADGRPVGSDWMYPGFSSPAKPGETIILWGVGFGLPREPLLPGSAVQSGTMPEDPVCRFRDVPARSAAFLVSPGLYQVNLTLPASLADGVQVVTCIYQGFGTPAQGAFVVKR